MLAIPAFQARTQTALFRANNKPPLEVVVANLVTKNIQNITFPIDFIFVCCTIKVTSLGLFYRSPSKCGIVLRIGALNLRTIVDSNSFFELVGFSYVLVKPFTRNN